MEIRTKYFIDFVCPIDAYGKQSFDIQTTIQIVSGFRLKQHKLKTCC